MKTFSKRPDASESRRHVRCAVCLSDCSETHWRCDGYAFVRCHACRHIYQNPQPDPNDLISRYDDEYARYELENAGNFLDLMLKGLDDVSFFDQVADANLDRSLLDIGCATGALLEHAARMGYRVQGVEVCEPAARYGIDRRGVPIFVGTLDEAGLGKQRFGAAHMSHVIEHIPDPRAFLRSVHRHLIPGGLMVMVTPNASGLQARLFGSRWRSAIADHVHLFSKRNLRRLLTDEGFQIIRTQTWGGLGIGTAAPWLKWIADRSAKRYGFGDVVLVLSRAIETQC